MFFMLTEDVSLSAAISVASVGSLHHAVRRYSCEIAGCSVKLEMTLNAGGLGGRVAHVLCT